MRLKEVVLVRVYGHGTSSIIDRSAELDTMGKLGQLGIIPPVYGTFSNGFCYGYVPGRVLAPDELFTFYPILAPELARFHKIQMSGHGKQVCVRNYFQFQCLILMKCIAWNVKN
jgi:hypothetical protein